MQHSNTFPSLPAGLNPVFQNKEVSDRSGQFYLILMCLVSSVKIFNFWYIWPLSRVVKEGRLWPSSVRSYGWIFDHPDPQHLLLSLQNRNKLREMFGPFSLKNYSQYSHWYLEAGIHQFWGYWKYFPVLVLIFSRDQSPVLACLSWLFYVLIRKIYCLADKLSSVQNENLSSIFRWSLETRRKIKNLVIFSITVESIARWSFICN